MEVGLASLEFVTISFDEIDGGSRVPPSSPIQLTHGSLFKCMFNSVDDVPALSMIFARSMTFSSQELSEEYLEEPSSLDIVIGESEGALLSTPSLQDHPPSAYDDLDWDNNDLLFDQD